MISTDTPNLWKVHVMKYVLYINDWKVNWKYTADFMVISVLFTVNVQS